MDHGLGRRFRCLSGDLGRRGVGFGFGLPSYGGLAMVAMGVFGVVLGRAFGFRTAFTHSINAGPVGPAISATLTPDHHGPATYLPPYLLTRGGDLLSQIHLFIIPTQ
jgi:hypothetical protein